uniref:Oxygen-regulated protein 1 n=1 Tax=Chelonoidis abingdonii TaxID=106734 RepID=A0A8C0H403_CHEAB
MSETPSTNYSMLQPNSSESEQTLSTRHFNVTEPVVAKRICFYKSGDPQFNGIKMVINNRSFKTFDALLDNLSKRVPIPFGVRNISTPRGIHSITNLEDLEDGKSYICSHHKKIKPINLERASKKPLPWQISRPVSARRRVVQLAREKEDSIVQEGRAVQIRTPKKLLVFKNGDIRIRCTIVLSKKNMQNFDTFLDSISELMQYPVLKLYTTDGRKVPNLQSLILCSGAIVAAGREPFKPGNYDPHRYSLPAKLPGLSNRVYPKANAKSESRNMSTLMPSGAQIYSVSSDKGYSNDNSDSSCIPDNNMGLAENHSRAGEDLSMVRSEDDIEKSVHVNQDGSMTVEMKVRFRIKEEETIKWTTTVSRAGVSADKNIKICNSAVGAEDHSSDLNISAYIRPTEAPVLENYSNDESDSLQQINTEATSKESESDLSTSDYKIWQNSSANMNVCNVLEDKVKPHFHRPPTPGPRRVRQKKALVESVTVISDKKVQEKMIGQFSYSEEIEDRESKSEYCRVTHSSSKTSSTNHSKLSEISNSDLLKLSLEKKKEETLIKLSHKTNTKTLDMPDEDGLLQNILEESVMEEGMYDTLLSSCKSNISGFIPSSTIYRADRPLSADTINSLHDQCGIKEIKRSLNSFIRCSELSQSKSEDKLCNPSDLLLSSQGSIHSTCTGNKQTKMTMSTCTNATPETFNFTTGSSPTTAESEKQFHSSTECDTTHSTDKSQLASSKSKKKKKKKRKSPSHYLEQGVHLHQNQQYKETAEEGTFKSGEMSHDMCITSESVQKSTMQIRDTYSETCQKRAMAFHVRNSDGSINSNKNLCPENELCSQVSVELQQNELSFSKKTKGNRQLTNLKSRSAKKISLPLSAKCEDSLIEEKADSKSETEHSQNTLGTEKEGICHCTNSIKQTHSCLMTSKPLSEIANGNNLEREKDNVISDSSYKSSKKDKKQKKKKNLSTTESKMHMSDGGNALDALKQEDFPDEIAEYSLENYVQNWLQNAFPNAVLSPNKLAPLNKKEGNVANTKLCHSPMENIKTLSDKETKVIANKVHITGKPNLIEHHLLKKPMEPLSEMGALEESAKWLYGRQIGSLTCADTSIMKEVKYLLQSDFQHDTKLQVFNEMLENDKKKLQSDMNTQDISPNQSISAEVAVQVDSKIFRKTETDAQKDCMSGMLLQQLQSTMLGIQKAHTRCTEKSCGPTDFSSPSLLGSSPNLLLAWLLVLNLKESLNGMCKGDMLKTTCSCSEIFSLLQFLKQIAVTEEAEELKDAVSNLQESTSNNVLHSGSRIETQDSAHCHENPFVVEIQNVPNFHERENPNNICISKDSTNSEENADVQELTEEFECSDIQKDPNASAETSDLNDLNVHKILSDRKYANANSNNCSLTSNVELSEENEEETDSSLQESQDKATDTSFNNEESGTSEEPNSSVHSTTSNDKDNILDGEISEVEDKKDFMHLGNDNAGEQDDTEKPNEHYKLVAETSTECDCEEDSVQKEKKENGTCEETPERLSTPSPLSFSYESKQITELDITEVEQKLQVKLIVKELENGMHSDPSFELKKCFKSPATSDWSDYRPDTDDSDYNYRASSDFTNESGEEAIFEKQYNTGYIKRTIEQLYGKAEASFKPTLHTVLPYMSKVLQKDSEESQCTITKKTSSFCQEHNSCFVEKMSRSSLISHEKKAYYSDNCAVRCTKQYCQCGVPADEDEGILIDKGKWLLKENHLVRRSPPEKTGTYGNLDTTSADTAFDNNSDVVPYSHFANLNQYPPHNEISSSEPEDMVKPSESGCHYFIMPHNSDSEPFPDLSLKSKSTFRDDTPFLHAIKKENNLSCTVCTTSMNLCTETKTNYPAFTSVEFRLPDNKVHPLEEPLNDKPIQTQPTNDSNANRGALEEQDSLDKLHAICGQHCPILMAIIKPVDEEDRGYAYRKASDIENQFGLHLITKKYQHLLWPSKDLIRDKNNHVILKNNCINKIASNIFNRFYANNTLDFINGNSIEILVSSGLGEKNKLKMLYAMEDMNINAQEMSNHENNVSKQVLNDITVSTNNKLPDTKQKICQCSRVNLIQILEEKSAPLLTDPAEGCHSETFHNCDIMLNNTECNASENLEEENAFAREEETLFCVTYNKSSNEEKGT